MVKEDIKNSSNNSSLMSTKNLHSDQRLHEENKNFLDYKKNSSNEEKVEKIDKYDIGDSKYIITKDFVNDKKKSSKSGCLPEKMFQVRNSLLTDLFNDIKHVKTIYNVFIAILIILLVNTAAHDLLDTGSLSLGLTTILKGFGKFSHVIFIWLSMVASSFSVYYVHRFWAYRRKQLSLKSNYVKVWDYTWLIIFIIYQITFIVVPAQVVIYFQLPPPSSFIILMEQVRLVMKIHAFVRSTVPVILSNKPQKENKKFQFPKFSMFSYFLFAPTLIYRDNYPRTKEIRWRYVASHFFEVILVVFYVAFMFERFVLPVYKEFGQEPFNLRGFILNTFFNTALPGIIIFLCGFYCLLHAWMNAFAELMRFGDRIFYKDWWNSGSYDTFYRTWNVVVYDWLYAYIYKDIYEIVVPGNKFFASICVFFISALFHEYILSYAFGFFYPVMFTMFAIFGYILIYLNRNNASRIGNIFMWYSLCTGSGIMISFYAMEYFARINCPGHENELIDIFVPRSWFCYKGFDNRTLVNSL
ncbi:sterol O-acyltransferase 1 isoform X2 [Chelonus insularis]|uniref:sterol O-acyltransferase 1 isoform X2 n=1 Tax=Chelonus insularis TaxID=460826 RepID=UPI00158DC220|nr:sterol O-acyltransferase 1 isoform X2 [Chelonus insularis]